MAAPKPTRQVDSTQIMEEFEYLIPKNLPEALALKARGGEGARFVAGGTDVQVLRRAGRLYCQSLISLRRLPELKAIEAKGDTISLGAGATLSELLESELVREQLPILGDALEVMGCTQMRNLATLGGNVMSAVASGDTLPPLLCLEARCLLVSARDRRRVPITKMFTGPRTTAARPEEILVALEIPRPGPRQYGAFIKLGRRAALDLAVVSLAVLLTLDREGRVLEEVRLAAGAVGPTPLRLAGAEEVLRGRSPEPDILARAAAAAREECSPWDDVRASRWYRREMIGVWLPRVVAKALARAGVEVQP